MLELARIGGRSARSPGSGKLEPCLSTATGVQAKRRPDSARRVNPQQETFSRKMPKDSFRPFLSQRPRSASRWGCRGRPCVAHCRATVDILGSGRGASSARAIFFLVLASCAIVPSRTSCFGMPHIRRQSRVCAGANPSFPFSQRSEADFGVPGRKR